MRKTEEKLRKTCKNGIKKKNHKSVNFRFEASMLAENVASIV